MILKALSKLLRKAADDIDGGNCDMSEAEAMGVFEQVKDLQGENAHLSKYQACKFLNVSRPTFDRMVADGEIPKGEKRAGFKELSWRRKDLQDAAQKRGRKA